MAPKVGLKKNRSLYRSKSEEERSERKMRRASTRAKMKRTVILRKKMKMLIMVINSRLAQDRKRK